MMPALAEISAAWLAARGLRETGFFLGRFEPATLVRSSFGVVRRAGRPIAFATLLRTRLKREVAIDLLRSTEEPFALDFLVAQLALALKAQGVQWLSLGISPAPVPEEVLPRMRRFSAAAQEHGARLFETRGPRGFKEQFSPVWEPRYIGALGGLDPIAALEDAAMAAAATSRS